LQRDIDVTLTSLALLCRSRFLFRVLSMKRCRDFTKFYKTSGDKKILREIALRELRRVRIKRIAIQFSRSREFISFSILSQTNSSFTYRAYRCILLTRRNRSVHLPRKIHATSIKPGSLLLFLRKYHNLGKRDRYLGNIANMRCRFLRSRIRLIASSITGRAGRRFSKLRH